MKTIRRSTELKTAEGVVIEAMRIAKLANPRGAIGISDDDMDYLVQNLARDYLVGNLYEGKKILDEAIKGLFSLSQTNLNITIGDFTRLCYSIKMNIGELTKTEKMINEGAPRIPKGKARKNIESIKEMLSSAMAELPYNKNIRVTDGAESMGIQELEEHLTKTRLETQTKLAAGGTTPAFENVEDPELRELYEKGWTRGLEKEEKVRYGELLKSRARQ